MDREEDLKRHGDTVAKEGVLNQEANHCHKALPQLSCSKAGKSLTIFKEFEMFVKRIIMSVIAGDWI